MSRKCPDFQTIRRPSLPLLAAEQFFFSCRFYRQDTRFDPNSNLDTNPNVSGTECGWSAGVIPKDHRRERESARETATGSGISPETVAGHPCKSAAGRDCNYLPQTPAVQNKRFPEKNLLMAHRAIFHRSQLIEVAALKPSDRTSTYPTKRCRRRAPACE